MYSFWDAYAFTDLVTYPGLWEGFGNQLLEAVWVQLPIVLFEHPVYRVDIAPLGFSVISLDSRLAREPQGSQSLAELPSERIATAAKEALHVLIDKSTGQAMVQRNFGIAKREYSMQALGRRVRELLTDLPPVGG